MRRKHKTGLQMKMFRHLIILLALLAILMGFGLGATYAQTYPNPSIHYEVWSGDVSGETITQTTNIWVIGNVNLKGPINIGNSSNQDITVHIHSYGGNWTIKRDGFTGHMFRNYNYNSNLRFNNYVNVNGYTDNYTLTLDGGATFDDDDARNYHGTGSAPGPNGRIIIAKGQLIMRNVILQNNYFEGDGSCLAINAENANDSQKGCTLTNVQIKAIWGNTVIRFYNGDWHNAVFKNVEISYCHSANDAHGGIIRATGGVKSSLELNGCNIHHNLSIYGGAAAWNAGYGSDCNLTVKGGTKIHHNVASANGGAISTLSSLNLENCEIHNNSALNGGAICVDTYWGGDVNYSGDGFTVNIGSGVSIHDNTATNSGGGVYVLFQPTNDVGFDVSGNPRNANLSFNMEAGSIFSNHAKFGAGVAIEDKAPNRHKNNKSTDNAYGRWSGEYIRNVNISGGNIYSNAPLEGSTDTRGAGIYIAKIKNTGIADGSIGYTYGSAISGGGNVTAGSITISPSGGNIAWNNANNGSGGGMYIFDEMNNVTPYFSVCTVNVGGIYLYGNTCTNDGAGLYVQNGVVTVDGAKIGIKYDDTNAPNRAGGQGGGIYVNNTMAGVETTIQGGTLLKNNTADCGAGAYIAAGALKVQDADTEISSNVATTDGGGVYAHSGNVTLTSVTLSSNKATNGNGGGLYGGGGNITVNAGSITSNSAPNGNGGGVYSNSSSSVITFNSTAKAIPTFTGNSANNGGVLYMGDGTCNINAGTLGGSHADRNKATQNGGAIYVAKGTVNFDTGTISYNTAGESGGGLYVASNGTLNMTGNVTLDYNHVPANQHGGGVYLAGVLQIGNATPRTVSTQYNFASGNVDTDPSSVTINATNRNNVYLPNPVARTTDPHTDVITVVKNGLTKSTRVGFSVPGNFVPVIYCNESDPYPYLESFLTPVASGGMKETVFDDAEIYHTVHYTFSPYDAKHIYLSSGTWVEHVTTQPTAAQGFSVSGNNVTISSEEGLAWLIRYINGIAMDAHAGVNVTLTKDLNMGAYPWVPMASKAYTGTDVPFTGTFDGQGHTIANINLQWLGAQTGADLGLFGNIGTGGTVKNVTLKDASITTSDMTASNGAAAVGSIAGRTSGGTVMNCTSKASLVTTNTSAVLGGLVGQIASGTVHSSYALPELTGYQMGGLAGSNSGNLYNSFANPLFHYSGATNAYFVGGLVAVNTGHVENCYVRLSRTTQGLTGAKFGMLAGSNSGTNTIVQCYGPDGASTQFNHSYTYLYGGATTGLSNCDLYKKVDAPYLYNRPNDNLVGSTGKVLYEKLNEWVSSKISSNSSLAYWKRTTAGGYSTSTHSGNINDDYPILMMKDLACAASPDGLFVEYGYSLDDIIMKYNGLSTGGTVWVYATPLSVYGSTDPDDAEAVSEDNLAKVKLYIDEDATLLQADGNSLTAFTSQTLRKNPTTNERWHFASSSLTSSTIGFSYGSDGVGFSWATNPCGVSFSTDNDNALFPGDLTSANITSVDLYCFYEPEYHWLNLKRNTNSHWHMNATTTPIVYNGNGTGGNGNETYLIPGKGYLMSIDKDQLLQNQGTLNTGSVTLRDVTYTTANEWAGLLGYNLLGNPYQSYLHFGSFVAGNGSLYASKDGGEATYATYDPEVGGYVQYKAGASRGSLTAGDLIHPHQGFLIRRTGGSTNVDAEFTDGMRRTALNGSASFRGEQPAYPLINLMVTDDEGDSDIAVLELDRDNDEGAEKLRTNTCKGWIYLHNDNEDYAVLFRTAVEDYQPLWFEATEAGTYTLSWNTANGEFDELTLVDNITGVKTDMLGRDSYVFEADPEQYASRFKIVIGDYKDIEENNEDGPSTGSETFAFQMGDGIVVNGEGRLEVIDMLGRIVRTEQLQGSQSTVRKPETAGVYVLRLMGRDGVRTQKIVIR